MKAAAQEAGYTADLTGKSVTALEIEFGVLNNPDQCKRSRFYFRTPLPYDKMPPEIAAIYSDEHTPDPVARAAHEKLVKLKDRIKNVMKDRCRDYTAPWDNTNQKVTGLEAVPLPLLNELEAKEIAHTVCLRYHKTLNRDVLGILLAKKLPDGSPSAGNPLWLELALEVLLLLDADDFARMDKEFTGTNEEKLHALLMNVASILPPDIETLYAFMLQRTEDVYGEKLARQFACLTAISRTGLRDADLKTLYPLKKAW